MEPLTLIMVLVVSNCDNWNPYLIADDALVTFAYLRDEYQLPMNAFQLYCVQLDELEEIELSSGSVLLRSWVDTPNSFTFYMFAEVSNHKVFFDKRYGHVNGGAYSDNTRINGVGSIYDGCSTINSTRHLCTVYKADIRLYDPKDASHNTYSRITTDTHEASHLALMYLGYPDEIAADWVHQVAAKHLINITMFWGLEYAVPMPYPVHQYPPSKDGTYIWVEP